MTKASGPEGMGKEWELEMPKKKSAVIPGVMGKIPGV